MCVYLWLLRIIPGVFSLPNEAVVICLRGVIADKHWPAFREVSSRPWCAQHQGWLVISQIVGLAFAAYNFALVATNTLYFTLSSAACVTLLTHAAPLPYIDCFTLLLALPCWNTEVNKWCTFLWLNAKLLWLHWMHWSYHSLAICHWFGPWDGL